MRPIATNDRRLRDAMTVKELIEVLEDCDQDARVLFTCDYGDYSHTQQALPVASGNRLDPKSELLTESAYSHSGLAVEELNVDTWDDDDVDEYEEEYEVPNVVILRAHDVERD